MIARFCLYGFLKNQRYFEPFFMLFFLDQDLSFFMIGLLVAVRELTVNLSEIPSGAIADSFGRRGSMIFSFAAYIVSFAIFAGTSHWAFFALAMVSFGIGDSFRTGTHKAMIFEWLRMNGQVERRIEVYGHTRSWSQIGSAVSGLLAAIFILAWDNYRAVFLLAIVPYLLNILNVASYPAELNGNHGRAESIRESLVQLKATIQKAISLRPLRRLMLESMGWEGYFNTAKDYLQPALQSCALVLFAWMLPASQLDETQKTALLVGPVYAILFLISAYASRNAFRLISFSADQESAVVRLWFANALTMGGLAVAAIIGWPVALVVAFVALHILYNVWRPILIGRFDELSEAREGATMLSLESQSQRLFAMVIAPVLGFCIDVTTRWTPDSPIWPVGLFGFVIALGFWMRIRKR